MQLHEHACEQSSTYNFTQCDAPTLTFETSPTPLPSLLNLPVGISVEMQCGCTLVRGMQGVVCMVEHGARAFKLCVAAFTFTMFEVNLFGGT